MCFLCVTSKNAVDVEIQIFTTIIYVKLHPVISHIF